jgi:protein-tyrosine-phosphatase
MAQGLFAKMLFDKGLADIISDSAGIMAFNGMPPSEYSVEALMEDNIDISRFSSKRVNLEMLKESDIIVCLSPEHLYALKNAFPDISDKLILLGKGIDDPYGLKSEDYLRAKNEIKDALKEILEIVEKRYRS